MIQAHSPVAGNHSMNHNPTVAQTQQRHHHIHMDQFDQNSSSKKKHVKRAKRAHHSQAYDVDEKFSLKVQKKPINGL